MRLDVPVQRRRNATAAKRLMRKPLKRHDRPRVLVTDKLRSYPIAITRCIVPTPDEPSSTAFSPRSMRRGVASSSIVLREAPTAKL